MIDMFTYLAQGRIRLSSQCLKQMRTEIVLFVITTLTMQPLHLVEVCGQNIYVSPFKCNAESGVKTLNVVFALCESRQRRRLWGWDAESENVTPPARAAAAQCVNAAPASSQRAACVRVTSWADSPNICVVTQGAACMRVCVCVTAGSRERGRTKQSALDYTDLSLRPPHQEVSYPQCKPLARDGGDVGVNVRGSTQGKYAVIIFPRSASLG